MSVPPDEDRRAVPRFKVWVACSVLQRVSDEDFRKQAVLGYVKEFTLKPKETVVVSGAGLKIKLEEARKRPVFRDASCDFVDRALTIEQRSFELTHYSGFCAVCFATLCASFALFAVAVFVLPRSTRRTRKETQREEVRTMLRLIIKPPINHA